MDDIRRGYEVVETTVYRALGPAEGLTVEPRSHTVVVSNGEAKIELTDVMAGKLVWILADILGIRDSVERAQDAANRP